MIFVGAIEKLGAEEGAEGFKEGGGVEDVEADVHELIELVGLGVAGKALDLVEEGAAEDLLEDGVAGVGLGEMMRGIVIAMLGGRLWLLRLGFVVAGVNEEAEELVGVFLAAKSKVAGEEAEITADLGGDEWGVIDKGGVGEGYLALEQAQRADGGKGGAAAVGIIGGGRSRGGDGEGGAVVVGGGGGADGGVGVGEAKVGKGGRVGEALQDAVEVAGVAQILEPQRR